MVNCVIKPCRNYTNSLRKKKSTATFHRFPKDPVVAEHWLRIIRESRNELCWKPYPTATICSAHFHRKDKFVTKSGLHRIKPGAIPAKGLFSNSNDSESDESEKENVVKFEYLSGKDSYFISYVSGHTEHTHIEPVNIADSKQKNILEEALRRSDIEFGNKNEISDTLPYSQDNGVTTNV